MNPLANTLGLPEVSASSAAFPAPLTPVDDLPPATVITSTERKDRGEVIVRGTTSDSGVVARVVVNGTPAHPLRPNFAEWEAVLPVASGGVELNAAAVDEAGNIETRPHRVSLIAP
jgi:hypothetical protein